ncbi:MAG: TetR/AcrR family transcriptional regulator [Pseudomonadota bacterium]
MQERAQRTRRTLLDRATELLIEQGLEALNTNRVAELAEVRVATLYRYFDDKYDVLRTLAEEYLEAEAGWSTSLTDLADPEQPLGQVCEHMIEEYWQALRRYPAIGALRTAMRALPELRDLETQSIERWEHATATALVTRAPTLVRADARAIARLIVESICNTLDRSLTLSAREQRRRRRALTQMINAYLETALPPS